MQEQLWREQPVQAGSEQSLLSIELQQLVNVRGRAWLTLLSAASLFSPLFPLTLQK